MNPEREITRLDWSALGRTPPTALVDARTLAHHAVQWPTRAARANLAAQPDDSHSTLAWDDRIGALLSQPLPARAGDLRIGVRLADLVLIAVRAGGAPDELALDGRTDAAVGAWVDSVLQGSDLQPASAVALSYTLADHPLASAAPYHVRGQTGALEELARWFRAAAEVLEDLRAAFAASPLYCWPHHLDIATVLGLEEGDPEHARSIAVGVSPGDEFYAQPYAYLSPSPALPETDLPVLPRPGHWHTRGFVGAVATGEEILKLRDRRREFHGFLVGTVEVCRARLGA